MRFVKMWCKLPNMGKYDNADRATTVRVREPIGVRVAENVRVLRDAQGLSQGALAATMTDLGRPMAMSAISKIEMGQRRVDPDDLVALAIALDVNPSRLLLTDQAGEEAVPLTPKRSAEAWAAWQWADGQAPLPSRTVDEEFNTTDEYETFQLRARPTALRRQGQHPLVRTARSFLGRVMRLTRTAIPHPAVLEMARRDLERLAFELDDLKGE